ncbi:hypothetical protein O3M35_009030 [Rhynocoris fuscipes]|uniref:Uncharacterized protein n=1 Tax=Rhynocoris fuscipes TaxID=488301 RepID=A0AAW1D7G3_9HEMI
MYKEVMCWPHQIFLKCYNPSYMFVTFQKPILLLISCCPSNQKKNNCTINVTINNN